MRCERTVYTARKRKTIHSGNGMHMIRPCSKSRASEERNSRWSNKPDRLDAELQTTYWAITESAL